VWNLESGQLLRSLEGHTGSIAYLLLHTDGRRLISASRDGFGKDSIIKVWNLKTGQLLHSLGDHRGEVTQLLLHPDGNHLISVCNDIFSDYAIIEVWNLEAGQLIHSLEGYHNSTNFIDIDIRFRQNNESVFIVANEYLYIWNIKNGLVETQFTADAPIICYQEISENQIVAGDALGIMHFLEMIRPEATRSS
jgi:WD40 repeat protein